MMRLLALLPLLALLAGCDLPSDPLPTNPYDAAFPGDRQGTTPGNVRLSRTSPQSVTLSWDDPNSFESGFALTLVPCEDYGPVPQAPPVVTVGQDVTTATIDGLIGTEPACVGVSTTVSSGTPSLLSAPIPIEYPSASIDVQQVTSPPADLTVYAWGAYLYEAPRQTLSSSVLNRVGAIFRATGGRVGFVSGYGDVVGFVAPNTAVLWAALDTETRTSTPLAFARGANVTSTVTLQDTRETPAHTCRTLGISRDGRRAAGPCAAAPGIGVWDLTDGRLLRVVGADIGSARVVALTPDGQVALVDGIRGAAQVLALDLDTGETRWAAPSARAVVSDDGEFVALGDEVRRIATGAVTASGLTGEVVSLGEGGAAYVAVREGPGASGPHTALVRTADGVLLRRIDTTAYTAWDIERGGLDLEAFGYVRRSPTQRPLRIERWSFDESWRQPAALP